MAGLPSAAPHTLWILFFLYTTHEVTAAGHIQEFACFTDYDKELVCHWKVPAQTDCSREFLLYYQKDLLDEPIDTCVPEDGKDNLSCTCTIRSSYFVYGLTYVLDLRINGTNIWNYSVRPATVVKPRPPKNLTIEKAENGNFNLSWEESYSPPSMLFGQPVIYEVKYWRKQHPAEEVKAINYQAKSFEITRSSLRRGYDYVASVRCNYTGYPAYWSEWSEEVEFHCNFRLTAADLLQMAVPVSCILIMAVSVFCYFCFTKVKKEWWDQIPNPAKSHLVVKNVKFSVLCYIDEMKLPFHDFRQSHMEKKISCKNCLAQSLSSQNFMARDSIRNVEQSCSCHSKCGEWFPEGSSAVLTPETVLVEESVEICECVTDIETESQEETSDQLTMFEPCESSVGAFREHTEHNEALATLFMGILADENDVQVNKEPGENKTFEKLDSENSSQQNPKEGAAQSQQPCGISHAVSLFTKACQDDYDCTASKKSEQSEDSFESGYQSSGTNSASLDARDLQHIVHQSLFPCTSESQHDSHVPIQQSPNKLSCGSKKDRISNPARGNFDTLISPSMEPCGSAYKSFDTLISPSMEPCGSAYKSFDTLISPSVEPCGSAYKSFDTLISPSVEPCGSAYKSFDTLISPSMEPCVSAYKSFDTLISPSVEPCGSAYKSFYGLVSAFKAPTSSAYKSFDTLVPQSVSNSSWTLCFDNMWSSPPLTQSSETPELGCGGETHQPPSNQPCYTNCRSPCAALDFPNRCSECTDCPSFSTHPNGSASAFPPEKEIYKQVIYQNIQKKANIISCPCGPQPSGYQPFDNAIKCNGTHCDNDSEVISRSLYEPFIRLWYNNLRETPPDAIICEPDQRTGDHVCLIVPGLASSDNVTQTSDGSLWLINCNELSTDSKDESTCRDQQLFHILELNAQDFNSRGRTVKGENPSSFTCPAKGMQENGSNRLNTDLHCHVHNCLRNLVNAGLHKVVVTPVVSSRCGSAGLAEAALNSIGLDLERKAGELLVSGKLPSALLVDDSCPSDSHIIHSEGSRLIPTVKERPVELLGEDNRKNGEKMKLVQALAQEDNCYMKVA